MGVLPIRKSTHLDAVDGFEHLATQDIVGPAVMHHRALVEQGQDDPQGRRRGTMQFLFCPAVVTILV